MEKRWVVRTSGKEEHIRSLAEELGISSILADLLVQRGVRSYDDAKIFFRPTLDQLHDPFLMKDMDKAVERIVSALWNKEKILIYGDYDVDGTTAVSLVYSFFKDHFEEIDFYIPDRYKEGYGVSFQGIDWAKENGFSLIICLDCGIKAVDKISYARENGVDFIVCDHHRPGDTLPPAVAVLDPKRTDCAYPYDELSGCGIGFKLVQAYAIQNDIPFTSLIPLLDLVVVSIASDIVPITGENRVLAYFGLKQLNSNPRKGIKAILDLNQVNKELTITDIVFMIGPRINAAGRLKSGRHAVELLTSEDEVVARESGQRINITNNERKDLDSEITRQALEMIQNDPDATRRKTTVLFHPEWHKGVIGIVASRLIEKHYRPTIILTQSEGYATGSARSVRGFDIYNAIDACSDLLEQFGGHKYAAGLTLKTENVDPFRDRFEEVVSEMIDDSLLVPQVEIDGEIDLREITPKFFRILQQFAPFGPGNMAPVFRTKNVIDHGYGKIVGQNHLKLDLVQSTDKLNRLAAIGFNLGHHYDRITRKEAFDVCYTIELNEWQGKKTIQLNVKDIKIGG